MSICKIGWLENRVAFDFSSRQNADELLKPFSKSNDPKMQRVYSLWMNADTPPDVAQKIRKECPDEDQIIRQYLWDKIVIEREEYDRTHPNWIARLTDKMEGNKKSTAIICSVIFLASVILGLSAPTMGLSVAWGLPVALIALVVMVSIVATIVLLEKKK